jgi:hypothetical protein
MFSTISSGPTYFYALTRRAVIKTLPGRERARSVFFLLETKTNLKTLQERTNRGKNSCFWGMQKISIVSNTLNIHTKKTFSRNNHRDWWM